MSPYIDIDVAVENVGGDYIFSSKPTPAIFADDTWDPEWARKDVRKVLDRAKGCHVEFVMKDISTVRNKPQRLWEWAEIAMEMVEG